VSQIINDYDIKWAVIANCSLGKYRDF